MRRPTVRIKRDMTDKYQARCLRLLGFVARGGGSMLLHELVEHPNRPGEYELMQYPDERRDAAVERLRKWAWGY